MTLIYESYALEAWHSVGQIKARFQLIETMLLTTIGKTFDGTWTSLEGKEVGTGSVIEISGTLYDEEYNKLPGGKEIKVYHKLAAGAYALLKTVKTDGNSNFKTLYKLDVDGAHRVQCYFDGDVLYHLPSHGPEMVVHATSALPPYPDDGIGMGEMIAVGALAAAVISLIVVLARRRR